MANNNKLVIGEVRFSYLHVFEPFSNNGGKPTYSAVLIIPKEDKDMLAKIYATYCAAYDYGVGKCDLDPAQKKALWKYNPDTKKGILHDGDAEKPNDEAFAGSYFINAKGSTAPGIVKRNPTGASKYITITDQNELYSGCYGYADISFFPYNKSGNKGVSTGLNNLLKSRDGDYLGGRISADAAFAGLDLGDTPTTAPDNDDIF